MEVFKIFATMSLQDLISNPLQKIQAQFNDTEKGASGLTGKLASLGKAMLPLAVGAGVVLGAFGHAVSVAAEFEQSMAATSTMFGSVAVDTQNLSDKILNLSSSTGIAATELNASLYNALSSGIPVTEDMGEAMDFMNRSSRLAKAGFTDIDTAVSTTAKILNAYKMDVSETDKLHKILIQTQNLGITTVGELGQSLAQVTPTAAAMNVSFEQIGAALASMTAQGTPTAQATTQLNALFAELGKNGTQASELLKSKTGSSFKELINQGRNLSEILSLMQVNFSGNAQSVSKMMSIINPATGKLTTFEEALQSLNLSTNDISGELINMFGSLDAGKAALALSGANAEAFTKNLTAMGTSADVVGDAYNKVTDTLSSSTGRLSASFSALMITIGQIFIPAIKSLTNILTTVTQAIQAFASTKIGAFILKAIGYVTAFVAVFGALIGIFLALKVALLGTWVAFSAVMVAISGFGIVGSMISGVVAIISIGFYMLGAAISAAIWPITLIVAGLALIGAAFYIFRDKIKNVILVVKGVFAVFTSLKDGVGEIRGELAEKIEANGLIGVITNICKVLYAGYSTIKNIFDKIKIFFVSIPDFFTETLSKIDLFDFGSKLICSYFDGIMTIFEAVKNNFIAIKDFFKDIFNGVSLFDAGKKLISTFADGILSVLGLPKEVLMKGLSSLRNLLPFSDAKEGPLSTLTLSGQRMITTIAGGVSDATPTLKNATASAFQSIGAGQLTADMAVTPIISDINTPKIPDVSFGVVPQMPEVNIPTYETEVNAKNTPKATSSREDSRQSIVVNINEINLPEVTDSETFINSLRGLALSLGVKP